MVSSLAHVSICLDPHDRFLRLVLASYTDSHPTPIYLIHIACTGGKQNVRWICGFRGAGFDLENLTGFFCPRLSFNLPYFLVLVPYMVSSTFLTNKQTNKQKQFSTFEKRKTRGFW